MERFLDIPHADEVARLRIHGSITKTHGRCVYHRSSYRPPRTHLIDQLPRLDVAYDVRFYGRADRLDDGSGRALWTGGQEVLAVAYDVMIPGYKTKTTNNLRLWESKPKRGFDLNSFNGRSMPFSADITC